MDRTSRQVASQAIIYGTLGFRASLEVTEHPRSPGLCSRLPPWLDQLNLDAPIEDFHREILETPYRELSREFQVEAYWRGEAASLLGWTIQLFDRPNPTLPIDPGFLATKLRILHPAADVSQLISRAHFRPRPEIDEYCAFCLTVRHHGQVLALPADGKAILNRLHQSRLAELGLRDASLRLDPTELEAVIASSATNVKGLYVARGLTAEWLLGKDL